MKNILHSNKDIIDLKNYICEQSEELTKIYKGNITVNNQNTVTLRGILDGNISLSENAVLNLYGTVTGNLFIENANINIYGTLNGNINNIQGRVFIAGVVNGFVNSDVKVEITQNAKVEKLLLNSGY